MTRCLAGIAASGGGSGPVPGSAATHYDGVADYQQRLSNFTGLVDGKKGTLSFWIANDATFAVFFTNADDYFSAGFGTFGGPNNYVDIVMKDAAGVTSMEMFSLPTTIAGFTNVLASWDVSTGALHLYINDADRRDPGADICIDAALSYNRPEWDLANDQEFATPFAGCLSEVFFHPDYLDLSIESNRRKFINADLTPADLGANGQLPFGTAPIAYFPAGDGVNKGTGGDLDPVGAPSACSTAPDVYGTSATSYDGATDYYDRGAAMTGAPIASAGGTVSVWVKPLYAPGFDFVPVGSLSHISAAVARIEPLLDLETYESGADVLADFTISNSDASAGISFERTLPASFKDGNWHHILISWNSTTGAHDMYFDDVQAAPGGFDTVTGAPFTVDWSANTDWTVGTLKTVIDAFGTFFTFFAGCESEVFLDLSNYIDLSVEANRRKFISADLKPVSLGGQGQLPFGTPPIFYSRDGSGTNLGTGGSLTAVGTPSTCGSAP